MTEPKKPGVSYRFVPTIRRGFRPQQTEFALARPKSSADGKLEGPLEFPVDLTVVAEDRDGSGHDPKEETVSKDVRLYGPGDVGNIDQDQVTRVEPEPNTSDFPPNYFPLIEFDHAGFNWLFSPERTRDDAEMRARNRPWLALVVVEREKATLTSDGGGKLPVLEAPPTELPPPSETWAWAHAQVVGEEGDLEDVIGEEPSRAVSRLLCPRNLQGNTRYVAAVVPTFEPGRRAGLGRAPYGGQRGGSGTDGNSSDGDSTAGDSSNGDGTTGDSANGESTSGDGDDGGTPFGFAWSTNPEDGKQRLPVYYTWEFQTGSRDFETLVDELEPRNLSQTDIGTRDIDVHDPGPDNLVVDDPEDQVIDQVGALLSRSPGGEDADWPDTTYAKRGTLGGLLNRPEVIEEDTGTPVVGAPLYGQWYVDTDEVTTDPAWFEELNLKPTYRIAAGLGAEVVREHQEEFVGTAWDQAGEIEEMNRVLRGGQTAREASGRIHRSLESDVGRNAERDRGRFLQFTEPMLRRDPDNQHSAVSLGSTLQKKLEEALEVPEPIISPAYRRLTSPRGALARNANLDLPTVDPDQPVPPTTFANEFVEGNITPDSLKETLDPRVVPLDGMLSLPIVIGGPLADIEMTSEPPSIFPTKLQMAFGGEGVPEGLARVHRFANWARSLAGEDLSPEDIRTATPSTPEAFVLRKVDTQLQAAIEGLNRSYEALRDLSANLRAVASDDPAPDGGRAPTELEPEQVTAVADRVRAVGASTIGPLDRTLDNLLSTRPDGVPAAIENDKDRLVQDLVHHHESALAALGTLRDFPGDEGQIDPRDRTNVHPGVDPNTGPPDLGPDSPWIDSAAAHILELLDRVEHLRGGVNYGDRVFPRPGDDVEIDDGTEIEDPRPPMELLDPEVTVPAKVLPRIGVDDAGSGRARSDGGGTDLRSREDPMAPVSWTPTIDRPMFRPLAGLAEEYLLPGVEDVPPKSVGALATNPKFVEAYLVGANHEFARELLWRRFPTGRRGTTFRKFWNDVANPAASPSPDVPVIANWEDEPLGGNLGTASVVLLLRGELLRQFPNTTIYLARAKWTDEGLRVAKVSEASHVTEEDAAKEAVKFPTFRGTLDPDITFLGFDLPPADAIGDPVPEGGLNSLEDDEEPPDPGWFFVFEEPMGETRFGLDAATGSETAPPPGVRPGATQSPEEAISESVSAGDLAWNGLTWDHVAGDRDPSKVTHVDLWASPPGGGQDPTAPDETETWRITKQSDEFDDSLKERIPDIESSFAVWGRNSAHMARITFQRPTRVTIHADDLLGEAAADDDEEGDSS